MSATGAVSAWRAIPAKVRWILVGLLALLIAFLRVFFLGKAKGEEKVNAGVDAEAMKARIDHIQAAADAGDDAGVQAALADAARRAAETSGRN